MKFNGIKVLCAEDEEIVREAITHILALEIEDIITAKDGLDAYEKYKLHKPDILLTDINMPYMSGIELVKKIRQEDQNLRIVMLTAHSEVNLLLEATELKLTKYLLKPITTKDLMDSLELAVKELDSFQIISKDRLKLSDHLIWDFTEMILLEDCQEVHLTPKERKILQILFSNRKSTVTYDTLLNEVWEDFDTYAIDTLKTMIKNIRKKVPKEIIKNVYGTGFKADI